ncbi:hypothetical protein Cob_v004090 [Colletotrichum orbiculare MAFF 240422]|uniref:Uncharacterized protein n=1 Tax=Colletotrichum orbiculare (strain 104-T / ATCC 96160 / CBS 514.97 / LARS 414 / MAFF 240422) TaxID=1213857 RepID=A0A484FYT9_COLOR|nr:hypothetical protein Cob_v004090 [Colletotrichum orbiculare MAFF 240422]
MDAERYRKAYEQIITNHEWIGDGHDHSTSPLPIVYELMNDSVLLPFIESVMPSHADLHIEDDRTESRQGRSRLRIAEEPGVSGATSRSASASAEHTEREGTTDDGGSAASPGTEPMTPPTTPPTSDWTFSTSPGGFQRALVAHKDGWKKVGAKLGLHRKSRSNRRNNPPSSAPTVGADMTMLDASTSQRVVWPQRNLHRSIIIARGCTATSGS